MFGNCSLSCLAPTCHCFIKNLFAHLLKNDVILNFISHLVHLLWIRNVFLLNGLSFHLSLCIKDVKEIVNLALI